jgi:hypothetical protein
METHPEEVGSLFADLALGALSDPTSPEPSSKKHACVRSPLQRDRRMWSAEKPAARVTTTARVKASRTPAARAGGTILSRQASEKP